MRLGIDVGGTKVALAVGEGAEGRLLGHGRIPFPGTGDPRRDVDALVSAAGRLLEETGVATASLASVGVSAPGPLAASEGRILSPPNLSGWRDVPLGAWLGEAFGVPVVVENDADA